MALNIISFLRKNWFKLLCIGLLIYVFFKKDLSFHVNMKAPGENPPISREKPLEQMTDRQAETKSASLFDRLELPGLSNNGSDQLKKALQVVSRDQKMAYLKRFARVAISERQKFGVPSSIILANALLQSTAGQSEITQKTNNHFSLAAMDSWEGTVERVGGRSYRTYENAWSSFRDHSTFLAEYDFGKELRPADTNFQEWAKLIEETGLYAESDLSKTLLDIISEFQLYELDSK
ncbi:MAG: hypothetical protein GYB31_11555 [Bacteroidetes bacterium]|nr:hypothetical protein [Bacteroidota bacterium]